MRALLASGAIVGMALLPWAVFAAPLDGSAPMLCAVHQVMDCEADNCERTLAPSGGGLAGAGTSDAAERRAAFFMVETVPCLDVKRRFALTGEIPQ